MKIDIQSIDLTSFKLKEGYIAGKKIFLINPVEFDCKWTPQNLNLRSVIIDEFGIVLSQGFSKFFNATEKPDLYPNPEGFNDWVLSSKEDGSLLICDLIYDTLNARTRGTINFSSHDNTSGFNTVINKYDLNKLVTQYPDYSFLYEMYDPDNIIVLKKYNEPEIIFLGAIHKPSGIYVPFYSDFFKDIIISFNFKVPEIYKMTGNIVELSLKIKEWSGQEGIVLKYNNSQNQIKIKTDWYLLRHRLKSDYASVEKLLDLWISQNKPSYIDFHNFIEDIDYELSVSCDDNIKKIITAYKDTIDNISKMKKVVTPLLSLSRKDAALKILSEYKEYSTYLFKLLSGKELDDKDYKKLTLTFLE